MYNRGGHNSKKANGAISHEPQNRIISMDGKREKKSNCFSVRLPSNIHDFLRELSEEKGISASEILRIVLLNRLKEYLGNVRFVDNAHSRELIDAISDLGNELHKIRIELNRIGVNYYKHLETIRKNLDVEKLQKKLEGDRIDLENLRKSSNIESLVTLGPKIKKAEVDIENTKKEIAMLESQNKKTESENAVRLEKIAPVLEEFKRVTTERGKKISEIVKKCY